MFEALCGEDKQTESYKNLFQPKKKTENTWKCPHPTNRVPILIAPVFK